MKGKRRNVKNSDKEEREKKMNKENLKQKGKRKDEKVKGKRRNVKGSDKEVSDEKGNFPDKGRAWKRICGENNP